MSGRGSRTRPGAGRARAAAALTLALLASCASAPAAPPPSQAAAWPEDWGIRFALRCRASGEDPRVCVCLANAIQRRWTPEELRAGEPEGLAAELARCRALAAE